MSGTNIRQVLGVNVDLRGSVPAPDSKWFNVFQTEPTEISAKATVVRTAEEPHWTWDASEHHLYCNYGAAKVSKEPGPAYPALIFAAEMARQHSGYFSIHSSCVQSAAGGLLLTGGSGAGKTSLALELCRSKGWQFISADRTSLTSRDGALITDGVWPYFRLRAHSFAKLSRGFANAERNRISSWQTSDSSSWDRKLLVHHSELGLQPCARAVPITATYDVKVIQDHPLEIHPYTERDRTFFFAGALSDNSSGRFAMSDVEGKLLGTPFAHTSAAIRHHQAGLVHAVSRIPLYKIRGSLNAIVEHLEKEHNA
ncbi:hypothetical protein NtRootA4_37030 [Arthrobacter sp. NtRootA4]|uniref:hypothetical protein n=1 Tax=Paenarthrobacter TaxID=1742992 RepID=UPI001E7AE844|nr:hypothetical protein NtRootA2_39240 [Arthrobacter sp. NtRootA2]BCW16724.1 hypothetical protein NtRootA4_37030 [Arthrobacter sp. NtRootA4]BCW25057.1 hypothetical protein NtRootC7_39240 [Arthrobacter sp. NtRootC7]BCW29326.1 hypothetical protein NtRootC45_39260 [Arthrobacter sp. NtRootC45]BCW33597.1 hypothetical protein NtRootD5_39280 [Arthrobacter sp. NtRootD5]